MISENKSKQERSYIYLRTKTVGNLQSDLLHSNETPCQTQKALIPLIGIPCGRG